MLFHAGNGLRYLVSTQLICRRKSKWKGHPTRNIRQCRYSTRYCPDEITDLNRFLNEVGTDPKEARYWLKQFKIRNSNAPFAVIKLEPEVFKQKAQIETLASSLSFLHRNHMRCVVVHGRHLPLPPDHVTSQDLAETRLSLINEGIVLANALEGQDTPVRHLFNGASIIQTHIRVKNSFDGVPHIVNTDLLEWCVRGCHVPIIPAVGETSEGQSTLLDLWGVTECISRHLLPLKVMNINTSGGFLDTEGNVVANINLPTDLQNCNDQPWYTQENENKTRQIYELLKNLPKQTSVVTTSVDKFLQELFTHHGSGTFFKITEPIQRLKSLESIDLGRLKDLMLSSFGRSLEETYFDELADKLTTVYLSGGYDAAAIVTDVNAGVMYLDKFAVSLKAQGEGTGEIMWEQIRHDHVQLFWRSRNDNPINAWYFKMSDGSWSNGEWTVFWYGIADFMQSSHIIDIALSMKHSFV